MFQLDQVSFSILKHTLIHSISLNFEQGKVYGLIGHNGSGKSTLLKLMARQQKVSSGNIQLFGRNISVWNQRDFAKQVAYLAQHLPINTGLTVKELVAMGRYAWKGLFNEQKKQNQQIIEQAMQLTHTNQFAYQSIDHLSGGERLRVWLAMLLAQQSQFLLLDEPLAPLDIAHQVEVMQLLKKLSQELNLGVVIVIHDINLASSFCDHLIALHSGKLLMQGDAYHIMTPDSLKAIYGIQLNVINHPDNHHPVSFY
ncbi:MAG: ATP-binding cassette domain-containing protein [[Pasteurella] aerogenes]|nr:ATP-binding cassette domain-containing protein [[Pasteurella] aerogenes]